MGPGSGKRGKGWSHMTKLARHPKEVLSHVINICPKT